MPRAALQRGRVARAGRLDFGPGWGPDGFALVQPPVAEIRAEQDTHGGIHVVGVLRARLEERCSRCLESSERDVEVPIDFRYEPGLDVWDEGPGVYRLDDEGDDVNVAPVLREELVLALPDYPVCGEECRGLCPRCGENRNELDCDCGKDESDPRWDALREQLESDRKTEDG